MSYVSQTFTDGDVLTAADMNNINGGIVEMSEQFNTIDSKLDQILNNNISTNYTVVNKTWTVDSDMLYTDLNSGQVITLPKDLGLPTGAKFFILAPSDSDTTNNIKTLSATGKACFMFGFFNSELTDIDSNTSQKSLRTYQIILANGQPTISHQGQSYDNWDEFADGNKIVKTSDEFSFLTYAIAKGTYKCIAYYWNGDTIF